ncbi:MAG: glycosyltransferase family 4 protein [bacterium]|nr:glycosyltransferase family 4 protein [bacterium]
MKRVLLITDDFAPAVGGVASYYREICSRLPAAALTVLTIPQESAREFDREQSYRIIREPLLSTGLLQWPRWRKTLRSVRNLLPAVRPEVLWVGQILPYGTVAWLLQRQTSLAYVVSVHGMDIAIPRGRRFWLAGRILRDAQHIVANSHATQEVAQSRYRLAKERITVVTPGVAVPRRVPQTAVDELRRRYGLVDAKLVITVGRLVPRKNHRLMLEMLQRHTVIPSLRYVIVGDGPEREALERDVRRRNLGTRVVFAGRVDGAELSAWYEAADIVVLTPRADQSGDREGFGMVYLEAASFGKPVIGSDIPGVREAVTHNVSGILIPPDDADALAHALHHYLSEPSFAHRIGIQAQDLATRRFSWENRAAIYRELFS